MISQTTCLFTLQTHRFFVFKHRLKIPSRRLPLLNCSSETRRSNSNQQKQEIFSILERGKIRKKFNLPAKFAVGVNRSGICGALHVANPLDACSSLRNRFKLNETEQVRIALIVRGECPFEDKVRNAQNRGFNAAIIYDDRDKRNLVYMMMNPEGIKVPAVFVSKTAGEILKEHARGEEGECCIYLSHSDRAWTVLAISFLSLLVIVAFIIIAFIVPRHWIYWQRTNLHGKSVDMRTLEGLPCFTFHSAHLNHSHSGETCAICLEDYKDGEILKVLPCQHEFHSICVGSWLTKWGTFCPVCKFDMKSKFLFSEFKRRIWLQNQ